MGVHKVKKPEDLDAAVRDALRFDRKVLIEKPSTRAKLKSPCSKTAIERRTLCSIAGEINPRHEFYSYQAKYLDENGAALLVPAPISPAQLAEVKSGRRSRSRRSNVKAWHGSTSSLDRKDRTVFTLTR